MKKLILLAVLAMSCLSAFAQTTNYSLQFDGTDDYIQFGMLPAVQGGGYTIEGWFRTNLLQARMIFNAYQPGNGASIHIEVRETGKLRFMHRSPVGFSGGTNVFSQKTITDNKWHHFAAVRQDDGFLWLYIDGFVDGYSCGSDGNITFAPTYEIGRNNFAYAEGYRHFKGYLDDFRIWDYPRTAEQIYNTRKKELTGTELGLFAYYKFDETNSPCDVVDCSVNTRHGARNGANGTLNLPQYSTNKPALTNVACGVSNNCMQLVSPPSNGKVQSDEIEEIIFSDFELADDKSTNLQILPNPASNGQVKILGLTESSTVRVFDSSGSLVSEMSVNGDDTTLDITLLPSGIYYFVSTGEGKSSRVGKLVKE